MTTQNESVVEVDSSSKIHIEEPKRYYVVMHNDDQTPIEFVVKILMDLYHHENQTAADLANKIHIDQKAIVGMYNLEIAEQKVEETHGTSRAHGYPLTVTLEQAD
tara:strand:+ start:8403 stop:8717 length:315 start_codon:yes stop_codon:yes gene_type:complete